MKHKFFISRKVTTWITEKYEVESDESLEEIVERAKNFEITPKSDEIDYDYLDYTDDYEVRDENYMIFDSNVSEL